MSNNKPKGKTKKIIGTIVLALFFILSISYEWYIFAGILVFLAVMLWNGKEQKKETSNNKTDIEIDYKRKYKYEEVGMFFMDLYEKTKKDTRIPFEKQDDICSFYFILGCACQGRIDEIDDYYNEMLGYTKEEIEEEEINSKYIEFLKKEKTRVYKMAKISEKVSNLELNLKVGESIGEAEDKQLKRRKTFMREYHYYRNLDILNCF